MVDDLAAGSSPVAPVGRKPGKLRGFRVSEGAPWHHYDAVSLPPRMLARAETLKAAGLDEGHRFHDLRHTFGTAMAAAGVPMRTVQRWIGHRDIETT